MSYALHYQRPRRQIPTRIDRACSSEQFGARFLRSARGSSGEDPAQRTEELSRQPPVFAFDAVQDRSSPDLQRTGTSVKGEAVTE